jgi:hypothetical protein
MDSDQLKTFVSHLLKDNISFLRADGSNVDRAVIWGAYLEPYFSTLPYEIFTILQKEKLKITEEKLDDKLNRKKRKLEELESKYKTLTKKGRPKINNKRMDEILKVERNIKSKNEKIQAVTLAKEKLAILM